MGLLDVTDAAAGTTADSDAAATEFFGFVKGRSLSQLSAAMLTMVKAIASTGLYATSYDNINLVFQAVEQIVGIQASIHFYTCFLRF